MRDIRPNPTLCLTVLVAGLLALGGAGCAEDSTEPPAPPTDAGAAAAPILNEHRLAANGKAILGPAGERIPIDAKQVIGYIDAATPNGKYIDLNGWAALGDFSGSAETVVAIAGKKSVAVSASHDRPDVADGYDKPEIGQSGFGLSVPLSALKCSAPRQGLKTFAIGNGSAGPVTWLADVPQRIADAC
jgi:hypothetical protein